MTVAAGAGPGTFASEVVPGDISGGTNTSHTIVVAALASLLDAEPAYAPFTAYEQAAVEANVLGKATDGSRRRTYRYLRELYLLRPASTCRCDSSVGALPAGVGDRRTQLGR